MQIYDGTEQRVFPIGASVRFKESYLAKRPDEQKRFVDRVGLVASYRMGASDPTVDFPKCGRRKAQRLIGATTSDLELVPEASAGAGA
jgi:hypothetical protein